MINQFIYILITLLSLWMIFKYFVYYISKGNKYLLKNFKNCRIFEYDFTNFKFKNQSLYNRQELYLIFNDNSKIHIFGGIEDKSIIPLISDFTNLDENEIKAGSMHEKIDLHQFVKNFETQSIFNVLILDKNDKPVNYYVSKILLFEGKEAITISLKNEQWKNVKFIKFESTIEIDASLFHSYYGY